MVGEVIPVLVSLLEDTDPEVQASATGALMFATVKPQGKRKRQFCWLLSGNPILRQLNTCAPVLFPPKSSVFSSIKAVPEIVRSGHFIGSFSQLKEE